MALLELRAVEAGYGSIQILHGVSLHVDPGEVVAVIGPNGAGKSTTFKVIMGFITHLGGEIAFDGRSLVGAAPGPDPRPRARRTCPRGGSSSAR